MYNAGGQAATTGGHAPTSNSGDLSEGDYRVFIDGKQLSSGNIVTFPVGTEVPIRLEGDNYKGFLLRLSSPSGVTTVDALSADSDDVQVSGLCTDQETVGGLTHTSNLEKTLVEGFLLMDEAATDLILDVTVVMQNNGGNSQYTYGSFQVSAEDAATEPPATDPPVTEPPVTVPPATDPPATERPATDAPVETIPPTLEGTAEGTVNGTAYGSVNVTAYGSEVYEDVDGVLYDADGIPVDGNDENKEEGGAEGDASDGMHGGNKEEEESTTHITWTMPPTAPPTTPPVEVNAWTDPPKEEDSNVWTDPPKDEDSTGMWKQASSENDNGAAASRAKEGYD